MLRKFNPFSGEEKRFSWWWLGVKLGVIAGLIIWWWFDQQNKQAAQLLADDTPDEIPLGEDEVIPAPVETAPVEKTPFTPVQPDDLRKIEGIGPKIQATLQAAGLQTYAQLAAATPAALKQILVEAGIRLGDPTTWPEQAALAAAGEWDQLQVLQSTLKGGRRA